MFDSLLCGNIFFLPSLCLSRDAGALPQDNFDQTYCESTDAPFSIDTSGVTATLNCSTPTYTDQHFVQHCRVFSAVLAANEDRLTNVVNGVGQREEVDYARGDDTSVYSRYATVNGTVQEAVYPQRSIPPSSLVKTLRQSNGQGGWIPSSYIYAGLMSDANGRGSLGFATSSTTDANGNTTDSIFSQNFP
jgi:hypothetical protein